MCDLKDGEFLDDFGDGVNGLGVGEQAVGDGRDDVKGAFQELPGVRAIQLPGAEDAIDAVPGEAQRGRRSLPARGHQTTAQRRRGSLTPASSFRNNQRTS